MTKNNTTEELPDVTHTIIHGMPLVGCAVCKMGDEIRNSPICLPKLTVALTQARLQTIEEIRQYDQFSARGCQLCIYDNGKFISPCSYHTEIQQARLQDRKDTLESVRGWVEKEKKPSLKKCLMGINKAVENNTFMSGYNQALDDLLTHLTTLLANPTSDE